MKARNIRVETLVSAAERQAWADAADTIGVSIGALVRMTVNQFVVKRVWEGKPKKLTMVERMEQQYLEQQKYEQRKRAMALTHPVDPQMVQQAKLLGIDPKELAPDYEPTE